MKLYRALHTLVGALVFAAPTLRAQRLTVPAQHVWLAAGVGAGTLGLSLESSLWYTRGLFATAARWTETVVGGYGTGSEHELTGLLGFHLPVGRSSVVAAGGLARTAGCFTASEFDRCKSLGTEAAPAWGIDVALPFSKHFGLHVAGFGVEGKRVQYSGVTAGLAVGSLR